MSYSRTPVENPLVPPGRHVAMCEHHWVEGFDFDGRSTGIRVLQWQPATKAWCHSDMYATGNDFYLEAKYYKWVGICPMPDPYNDREALKTLVEDSTKLHREVKDGKTLSKKALAAIIELCHLRGLPID